MTDKHYLEAELEERLSRDPEIWEFIRQSTLDGVWFWDLEDPAHEWMSPEFWQTFGYDPDKMPHLADAWQDIINPEDLKIAQVNVGRHIEDPDHPYDQVVRYTKADGSTAWVRCRGLALRDETGKAVRLLGAHTDLTELIVAAQVREDAFQRTNARLNAILDAAHSGIIGLDGQGQISFINPAARHMLGALQQEPPLPWPPEYLFLSPNDLLPIKEEDSPVQRSLRGEALNGELYVIRRRNGADLRYLRMSNAQVNGGFETDVTSVLILDDISEQERNRQQIERSSRLDALGQLTGGIAHDFNNMLATIEYAVQLSQDQDDPARANDFLQTALGAVRRGADLTQRLLAFAKSQPGLAKSWLIEDVFNHFSALVKPTIEERITLVFSIEDPGMYIFCDRSQLENAMLNLVLNSRDAIVRSGHGDTIRISARNVTNQLGQTIDGDGQAATSDNAEPDDDRSSRFVELAVSDNGPGMDEEVKKRATDPFFTTKESSAGTGLGLSMVYGFATQSQGQLRIYSELEHGTTVRILLPRGTYEGGREGPVARKRAVSGNGQHVLLVENEERLLDIMTELLISLDYKVTTATSGAQALAIVEDGLDYDLLLTDVVMPGKLGGFDLARAVRRIDPEKPVLYMSGYTGFSEAEMGEVVAPLIQKPCPPDELGHTLYDALNTPKSSTKTKT
ncbi:PAS domain-containing protein [Yoonia sp. R2331]|uniref:hybrid sensor histidine kinase/response regulator n=1 Tax=Yoonia sp. R2331 TaxID=3237238 RepID=UPI0034E46FA9